ncbi:hypothetical protein MSSIH_2958 [Methanosarcina siciliae HI350]|uniref:Uncharacterized protein n=1 Tax=Methanosarcina siciliae HI350 TaxID=1434119 RepID=A0A0E3PGZ3_9EURY|nr:glycosyltransferase family 4 protein [Methanosarcina siciliae]AKB33648.1 hypothetical protein MSSIH_2958 [Methanosarcina siciliae HI350]
MNLIYYYPGKKGAPSNVARNIFDALYNRQSELPFEKMIIFTDSKYKSTLAGKYEDIKILGTKEILEISKKDIIHIPVSPFVFPNAKFLLHLFAKIKNNKIVLNYHGDLRNEINLKYKLERKLDITGIPTYILIPTLLVRANKIIVNSHILESILVNNYGVKSIEVIPNAVENYWYSKNQEIIVRKKNKYEIFYHGRLSPEKGVDILITGFHEFLHKKNYPNDITLYIAGEGPQKKDLESLVQRQKIDRNVIFLGNIDKKLINAYLKKVDGAIYPSIWDNFPLSILEALASANCPVYFSKKIGICDFLTEEDVLNIFNPDTKSIKEIFDCIFENASEKKIVEKQKEFAKKYTWDKVINCYIKLYNEIV